MSNIPKCLCVLSATLAFVVSLSIQVLCAQTSARYNELAPDTFLKSWKVLGPIPLSGSSDTSTAVPDEEVQKKAFDTDFLAACGTETGVYSSSPPACKINGQDHSWKLVQSGDDILDLAKELGAKEHAVAYALAEVESSAAVSVIFGVGSDDAVKVWLNGKLVHANWIQRALQRDQDLVVLELRPGRNQLLMKIQNGIGDWSFAGRTLGPKTLEETLWTAAKNGDPDRLQIILTHGTGIQLNSKPKYDLTAWQVARIYGRADVTELLAAKGADITLPLPGRVDKQWKSRR